MNINKIADLLQERFDKIKSLFNPAEYNFERVVDMAWVEYLNGIDCEVVDQEDIVEDFENLFNHSAKSRVCIPSSFYDTYVLMPKELAEKALILGGLPDTWFSSETTQR